jgi:protein yippee-like 5
MGRVFLTHIGGTRLFVCANCEAPLTNRSELISTRFTGATGRAFLFNRVVNLNFSNVQVMLTAIYVPEFMRNTRVRIFFLRCQQ